MKKFRFNIKSGYLRQVLSMLLSVLIVMSMFAVPLLAAETTAETTPETNPPEPPPFTVNIMVDKSGGTPMLTAGTKAFVRLPFLALSNYFGMMYNITATITGAVDDPLQFVPSSAFQTLSYANLNATAYFDYEIDVPITAKPGLHSLTLSLTYDAISGFNPSDSMLLTGQTKTLTYYYTIINDSYDAIVNGNPLRITGSISPESVAAGDVFDVGIRLQNDISAQITGVSVTIDPVPGFLLLNDSNTKTVTVSPNGSEAVTFRISASDSIKGGPQQFTLTLSYKNPGGKEFSVQYFMVVNAVGSPEEDADKNPAKVEITSITLPESASAGDGFTAVVTLTNTSDKNAVIDELAVTNNMNILNRTNAVLTGMNLSAGETRSYEIQYFVPEDSPTAYANFTVTLKYKTEGGSIQHSASITGGMNIKALASPSLSIVLSADQSVKAGGTFTVTATVKNYGGDASNIVVTVNPAAGIVPKSQNKLIIEKLATGGEYKCTFQMLASDSALDGYNLIGVDVVCGDIAITQYTGTNVSNPEKQGGEQKPDMPVIIIDSYDYGENVYAGKPFTLTLTIKNTSKTTAIKEMKMVIQSVSTGDGSFTPTSSSNTFFVESLGAGASVTKQIELVAKSDSKPQSYPIQIVITYKNTAGDTGTSTEEISIPVQQELRFNKGALNEIGSITIADSGYLMVSAGNLGMSTIRNVRFAITGDGFTPTEAEYFAGTIEPGSQASHEFELIPYQPGYVTGTVTYTYEDTQGNTYSETQEFGFEIIDNMGVINPDVGGEFPDKPGFPEPGMEEPQQGFFAKYMWYIIGAGVIVAVVVIVIIVVAVRRRKKDEEDDY